MKITKRQLKKLIRESTNMSGRQFIMDNAPAFKSMGWKIVPVTSAGLAQLEYRLPGNQVELVIYQRDLPAATRVTSEFPDPIDTYVLSSSAKGGGVRFGIWGKEVPIDLTNLSLISAIISLIKQSYDKFGDEIPYLKQGIEAYAFASEDPLMIQAAELLDKALTPDFL
tara:strand:- start:871 stop:1374 length:504 start_codon:yes stop_codon:yes gene_type:complete